MHASCLKAIAHHDLMSSQRMVDVMLKLAYSMLSKQLQLVFAA